MVLHSRNAIVFISATLIVSVCCAFQFAWWVSSSGGGPYVPVADTNLVCWLTFPSTDTGGSLTDRTGITGSHTQMTAAAKCTITSDGGGSCGSFDGGDWARSPSTSTYNGFTAITISLWIKATSLANYTGLYLSRGATTHGIDEYVAATYELRGYAGGNAASYLPASTYAGAWHHLAMTWQTGTDDLIFYFDGAQAAINVNALAVTISVDDFWYIGSDDLFAGRYYVGLMDEIRVYNRDLTPTEIAAIYAEGRLIAE